MALITYPLNNIEYSAEDAELFHVTRTSGVYAKNSFDYSVTGENNTIVINNGIGWIKNSEFAGKVIALKENISLDMGVSDSVYPRIDAIVIQFDSNKNETNIIAKQGTAASSPIAPSVIQTESVYELHLYHVRREAGSLYISPSNITDLRLNSSYCGLMADSVTNIDTTAIEKQVSDLIKSLQSEISNVIDGSAYLLRDGSTNMTGNLPMDGHKVTGLGTPTADGDAVPLGYANQNFAPAHWGYGGAMDYIVDESGTFETKLNEIMAGMVDHSVKQFSLYDTKGLHATKFYGRLWRYTPNYATLEAVNYNGNKAVKCRRAGTWQPWEWENPPMADGVEYRTTDRIGGKVVYKKQSDGQVQYRLEGETAWKYAYVPTTRTVNGKALSSNITLSASDVGITGGVSTGLTSNFTESRAIVSNSSGKLAVSAVTSTELGYLDGVTSKIQTQLNSKVVKVKLWENAKIASTFNAQTISLALSGYDGVEILYYVDSTTNIYQSTGFIKTGLPGIMYYVTASSGNRLHRNFKINTKGIKFETAEASSGAAVGGLCIPYQIYGIKGVG